MTLSPQAAILAPVIRHDRQRLWRNWARNIACQPDYTFYPQTAEDLAQIIHFARATGRRIRAVATGHSWSAIIPTEDILVDVTRLNAVQLDLSAANAPRVVVECGATVEAVNQVLEAAGYALPANVVLESVRFGGLVATGSHGSGWHNQSLSDVVHAIEIVDAAGTLRRFEAGSTPEDVLNAARLNLGLFGLIYRITLNVLPTWNVRALDRRVALPEVLEQLPEWVLKHDNCDLFWWPLSERFWVKTWTRTDAPVTARPRHSRAERLRSTAEMHVYQGMLALQRHVPATTPYISPVTFAFSPSQRDQVVPIVEAIHYRRGIEITRMGCMEIAFKVDDDFANVRAAIAACLDLTRSYAQRGAYPLNVTLNVRFVHNSPCWLSPIYGAGHSCYIEVLGHSRDADWLRYAGELGAQWLQLRGAMPHWAKEYRHIPGVVEHIRKQFATNIARFKQIKAELQVDPEQMFVNQALAALF